ncbi:MAG: bi-domain-containing oxidoreductase [Candidatus Magasanikbacteria bacterium]
MKQVFQNPKSGETIIEEVTPPKLREGGVLVDNHFSLISPGTERNIIQLSKKGLLQKARERPDYVRKFFMLAKTKGIMAAWKVAQSKLTDEIELGYSSAGKVTEVGDNVEDFQAGQRVACAGQDYASHAGKVFVPKNLCVKVPDDVSDKEAAFSTLGAIAMNGIHQAKLEQGEKVAVIGLGFLGQLASRILKSYGHPVIGFDLDGQKVDFAKNQGSIDQGVVVGEDENYMNKVDKFSNGRGVDAALIYASADSSDPVELATEVNRDRGRVVQIGNVKSDIPWRDFYKKELSFHSTRSYGPGRYDPSYEEEGFDYPIGHVRWTERRNMKEFLRLLEEDRVSVDNLISGVYDIEDAKEAYERVFNPDGMLFGLLLSYPTDRKTETTTLDLEDSAPKTQKEDQINIGLIGAGSFATSTILPHLKEIKDSSVSLSAICDSSGKKIKDLGQKWGSDYVTSDYQKIIEDDSINLVICATRHSSHSEMAQEILGADKNLYIEKPLALNKEELEEVMESAQDSEGRLFVGFNRRFSHHFKKAREAFQDISTPLMVLYRINYPLEDKEHWSYKTSEGGRIIGEDCHFVDAINFLAGSELQKVHSSVVPTNGNVEREENTAFSLEYKDGSVGNVFYSALGNFKVPKEYIEIYGDDKIMKIDNFKSGQLIKPTSTERFNLWHQDKGYEAEMEELFEAIREGKPSPISLEELYETHIGTFAVYNSFKDGEFKTVNGNHN